MAGVNSMDLTNSSSEVERESVFTIVTIKENQYPLMVIKKLEVEVVKELNEIHVAAASCSSIQHGPKPKKSSLNVNMEDVAHRGGQEFLDAVVQADKESPHVVFDESVPWRCVFCKFRPNSFGLGGLFGPYYVDRLFDGVVQEKEIWIHASCSLWTPGVFLIGPTLHGLAEAVEDFEKVVCTVCRKSGATIKCLEQDCSEMVHVPCAKVNQWSLDDKIFKTFCMNHGEEETGDIVRHENGK